MLAAFRRLFDRLPGHRAHSRLIYVHIGKCGGESLWNSIQISPIISQRFSRLKKVHVEKPPICKKDQYIFVVRNPISRAISAFNWRYHLVVETQKQRGRFAGEFEILERYQTMNQLAHQLYSDGVLNAKVAEDFLSIHHLRESISFYLEELLSKIRADQIFGVFTTEFLDIETESRLGVCAMEKIHEHASKTGKQNLHLTKLAAANLQHFLRPDFEALMRLCELGNVAIEKRNVLFKGFAPD
jgi:hypothetical protein